ncbi:hypothetical protein COT20_02930 [bacterium (Candidatus Gribaldobacteria) CG08_land_8_20_14_0_20_39_15]|uniref:Uncharacterized protein n=1 Tax=bacterium (Candidatus Gribaldobacteria) CG08_land_8_20_14_0_20_39_15 TaxID=2014273 RepID=A0A2M6XTR5_9BACT|nr:MAG: hypothetical protein COT20_02930 [bacterium (Candidatus Gribaldobacteria) CG08_land_8_20_14_0_20_39_15]
MSKTITFTRTIFSKISLLLDDRKSRVIFFILFCLTFALVAVYVLQTGDLIQKIFLKTAYESKVKKAVQIQANSEINPSRHFSLVLAEEQLLDSSDFVPVERVEYIPLTASLAVVSQLVFSDK